MVEDVRKVLEGCCIVFRALVDVAGAVAGAGAALVFGGSAQVLVVTFALGVLAVDGQLGVFAAVFLGALLLVLAEACSC